MGRGFDTGKIPVKQNSPKQLWLYSKRKTITTHYIINSGWYEMTERYTFTKPKSVWALPYGEVSMTKINGDCQS